jgi:hypothetical protein
MVSEKKLILLLFSVIVPLAVSMGQYTIITARW